MKKSFVLMIAVLSSVFFFACKEEILSIAAPAAPVLPSVENIELPPPPSDVATPDPVPEPAPVVIPAPAAPAVPTAPFVSTGDIGQLNSGKYTIQVAVFPSEASAKNLVKRMADNGIKAYYIKVDNPAQLLGTYYRVRVGYFNGKSAAEAFAGSRLEPLGYAWWVDGSKNDTVGNPAGIGTATETATATATSTVASTVVDPKLEQAKQEYREIAREAAKATATKAQSATVQAPPPPPSPSVVPAPPVPQAAAEKGVEVNNKGQVKILDKN